MLRRCVNAVAWLAVGAALARGADLAAPITLDTRWWGAHEFGWRLGEAAGLRFAITDGVSARGRVGGQAVPGAQLAADFEKQTGIRAEVMGGMLVLHRPNEAARKALEGQLAAGGEGAVRAAWHLGWLKDARAWPALAKAAAGQDIPLALAAAQALRRLDGEEAFDLRRWILPGRTPSSGTMSEQGLWQTPLGAAFPEAATGSAVAALAKSPWVPLREAAARLAPGCGPAGRTVTESLAKDPSPLVSQAAVRALRAWQTPEGGFKPVSRPLQNPDLQAHWETLTSKGDAGARSAGPWIAAYGREDDIRRLIDIARTSASEHVRGSAWHSLIANAGGPSAVATFRDLAAKGRPWPDSNHDWGRGTLQFGKYGLAMLMDGEALAKELVPRLGTENWSLSSEFLLARFAGPPALAGLEGMIARRGHVAPLAIGFIGGPDAVPRLAPALESDDLSTAVAAARGLGETGLAAAVPPLVKALASPNRVVRSRAALGLGRIGGPDAADALARLLKTEKEYLPRRSACAMLREIDGGSPTYADLVAATERDLAAFVPAYAPVNPQFGPDFPAGRWVSLSRVHTIASIGETRCAVDPYAGVWLRYGGCSPCYSNECIGYDVASGKWFVVRPPENLGLFFNERRAAQGCSRGMAFDAKGRLFWINHAVGGNGTPANGWAYPGRTVCSYDLALDRFVGDYADATGRRGEGPTWFIADSTRGTVYTEWMGPTTQAIDTAAGDLVNLRFEGLPNLSGNYNHDPAGYDPVSGLVLRSVRAGNAYKNAPDLWGVWLMDPAKGVARKARSGLPEGAHGGGNAMDYDALNREVVLFLKTGAWRYLREKETWEKVADGELDVYVVGYDPQHNVFLASRGWGTFSALRLKNVPAGTRAFYGTSGAASE